MALAQQLLASGRGINGSAYFVGGMNSADDPMFLDDRAYFSAMNVVNRGGPLQSRPGYRCLFPLPAGRLQGMCYYRPLDSVPYLVFAVSGKVYASKAPFTSYAQLPNIQFYHAAKQVFWQVCTKSAQQNADGTLSVIDPVRLLVMQDGGYTRAAFWDGATSRHLDPGAAKETPIGGPMAWSGGRLWVASENRLFASDIDDPLSFVERTYHATADSFFMGEPIRGLAEIPGLATPQLAVFTDVDANVFMSGLRDRTTWAAQTVPPFQSVLFPNVGCVSHRSLISQYGLLWWMTPTGITNFNAAMQAKLSSVLSPQDIEMAASKGSLSPNLDDVCAIAFENYGLFSLPVGSKYNKHTWVMDKAVTGGIERESSHAWNGVWTGTFPVEWAKGPVNRVQRVFHVSVDSDGTNRMWEAFTPDRKDNGLPITSYVETKTHIDFNTGARGAQPTGLDLKKFVFAEITMTEMRGNVSAAVYWAGVRGRYKKLAEYNWVASEGQLKAGTPVALGTTVYGNRPQTRTVRTPVVEIEDTINSPCSSCSVESPRSDNIDVGFSLLIVWSGRAALRSYRIFADIEQETGGGACAVDETGQTHAVTDALCPT